MANVPTLRALRVRPVSVPMKRPLATATGAVTQAPLALVDVETDAGITGSAYVLTPAPFALKPLVGMIEGLGALVAGDPVAPFAIEQKLRRRMTLLGVQGVAMLALSAIDAACWDVAAKAAGLPLARLLGGVPRPVPAYNSNGLGIMGPERAAAQALELAEGGFTAIKIRLGYPTVAEDVAVVRAVRRAVGEG